MGRIIAIDYGKKRVGIAVTDPCQIIANSLTTVRSHEVLQFLQAYCSKEKVDLIVVGHPKQMDNTDSESMTYIKPFLTALGRKLPDNHVFRDRFFHLLGGDFAAARKGAELCHFVCEGV